MRRSRTTASIATLASLVFTQIACATAPPNGTPEAISAPRTTLSELANAARERRLVAGFLIVDGVYNTELTAPWDVLEHTAYHASKELGIEVLTISPTGGSVTTAEGLRIEADYGFEDAPPIDILVVPSAEASRDRDLDNQKLIGWVARTGHRAGAVLSLCWGAFVLARAGLLDDEACTTFPSDYDTFAGLFPTLDLRINVSFVHSGKTITSQGGVRSFEAAMYLVDRLYGESVAAGVGAGLLIPWPPESRGTSFFISEAQ